MLAARLVAADDAEKFLAVLGLDGLAAVGRLRHDGVRRHRRRRGLRGYRRRASAEMLLDMKVLLLLLQLLEVVLVVGRLVVALEAAGVE